MMYKVDEHYNGFLDVREAKFCMDVDGEHCLLLLHDPPSLQGGCCNTICHMKSGSVKMRGWSGLAAFFLH